MTLLSIFLGMILASTVPVAESGTLSSANASYDGSALVLKGQVVLDHGIGKMQADEAILEKQETNKDFPFAMIHLQKEVHVQLQNQGELVCDVADFDFTALTGKIAADGRISYTDTSAKKKGFRLLGKKAHLTLLKHEKENAKATYDIETIITQDDVEIDYGAGFSLHADEAVFHKKEERTSVFAYPKEEGNKCVLTRDQDRIEGSKIEFTPADQKLAMQNPRGKLSSILLSKQVQAALTFSADTLLWDHPRNTLSLKGNAMVDEPSLGLLNADDELILVQKAAALQTIKAKGKTTLTYQDGRKLISHGTLLIDREKMTASLQSPQVRGKVPEGKQLWYEENDLGLFADQALVEYAAQEGRLQPVSLSLKGHVKFFSRDPQKPSRVGLSDRISYSPTTRTFILSADPGHKVLFYNEEDNINLAAQEIHITEDPTTKKQLVKGIGNVQLIFTAEELSMIQNMVKFVKQIP